MSAPEAEKATTPSVVFRLGDRVLEDLRHVVEVAREHADLVVPVDLDALREVARGDLPRADGQRLDGCDEDARKQEREHHADYKAQPQRAQDDAEQLAGQRVDRRTVVQYVCDVGMRLCHDRYGQVHEIAGHGAGLADRAVHRGQQILRHADLRPLIRALEDLPQLVEDIDVAVAHVDAEPGLRHEQLLHLGRPVVLVRQPLELADEFR